MRKQAMTILFLTLAFATHLRGQTGGDFALTQTVLAGGGGSAAGGDFAVKSTSGQGVAGGAMSGGTFAVTSGFWNFPAAPPSAAEVSVSGRVMTPDHGGLANAIVTITSTSGQTRNARTGAFGYYRFDDVLVGETYVITVSSKRFQFSPRIVTVSDEISGLDFVGTVP